MSKVRLYQKMNTDHTVISNRFIDEYMLEANDAQLKVYLFLTRQLSSGQTTSISDMADLFNHTEKDIKRALKHWEKCGLMALEWDEQENLTGIRMIDPEEAAGQAITTSVIQGSTIVLPANTTMASYVNPVVAPAVYATPNAAISDSPANISSNAPLSPEQIRNNYTAEKLQKILMPGGERGTILFVVEAYVGHPLTSTELRTICYIKDELGFSDDLIDTLFQYCIERGKKDFRYIEKVAINWKEQGITTSSEALTFASRYNKDYYTIMNRLGRNNAPTEIEVRYITRWLNDLAMDLDVILEACDRAVLRTDTNRFRYVEGILYNWNQKGIHHFEDIAALDGNSNGGNTGNAPGNGAGIASSGNASGTANSANGSNSRGSKSSGAKRNGRSGGFNQFQQNDYDFDALEKQLLSSNKDDNN